MATVARTLMVASLASQFVIFAPPSDARSHQTARDLKPRFRTLALGVGYWQGSLYTAAGPVRFQVMKIDMRSATVCPVAALSHGVGFGLERTSAMAKRVGAIGGVNGSFFSPRTRQPMDWLMVDRRWLSRVGRRPVLVVREDGSASIMAPRLAYASALVHAIGGGPTLLSGGRLALSGWPRSMGGRAPRTAVGVDGDGSVLLLTIDGRRRGSVGATIREEARYMAALGARAAINLDGGGSSTMVVRSEVVNVPSGGSERLVSNALMVISRGTVAARAVPRKTSYSGYHFDRS